MNTHPSGPDPSHGDATEINDAITKKLRSYRWKGRALTGSALAVGLLAIVAGIVIAWANATMIMPMERLLLQDYPLALSQAGTNAAASKGVEGMSPLPKGELEWRHVQVTAAHGKAIFLMAAAIALVGVGAFLTLLLVIFNRHATLRQINASLAQISRQIREFQGGKGERGG